MTDLSTATVLSLLNDWYREVEYDEDQRRSKLLSKASLIELCGWIEFELDERIRVAGQICQCSNTWIEAEVIRGNHGFKYERNFRGMVSQVLGEAITKRIENRLEEIHPGELERLKGVLSDLTARRNEFAHNGLAKNVTHRQITLDAPSWSQNHYKNIATLLRKWDEASRDVLPAHFPQCNAP